MERCLQSSLYLLRAHHNIKTLASIIELAREAGELVPAALIYRFLEFAADLEKHYGPELSFSIEEVGITPDQGLTLAAYSLYFEHAPAPSTLHRSVMEILFRLITLAPPYSKPDVMDAYLVCEQRYGPDLLALVEHFMERDLQCAPIGNLLSSSFLATRPDSDTDTTVTFSEVSDMDSICAVLANE